MSKNNHIAFGAAVRGMTIVEMMLTLGIVAVLVAMATPSFTGMVQNSRIRGQSSDLLVNLAVARAEAAKRGQRVTMCPTTTYAATPPSCQTGTLGTAWGQGYMVFVDVNQDGAFNSGTDVLITVSERLSGNNILTSNGFTNAPVNALQFRPSGATNLPAAGGTFKLCDSRSGNVGRLITLQPTGRATSAITTCP